MVHPTWEGDVLWVATGPETAKAQQIAANPAVDVQFQVAPPEFVHLMVRGKATLIADDDVREHVWNNVMDYDLADFWPAGPKDPGYVAVRIDRFLGDVGEILKTDECEECKQTGRTDPHPDMPVKRGNEFI